MTHAHAPLAARFPLARKLALACAALAALPLIGTGVWVLDVTRRTVLELTQHLQGAVSDELSRGIAEELLDAEDALDDVGRILTDTSLSAEVTERLALSRVAADSAIDHVSVYGRDGALLTVLAESESETGTRPPEVLDASLRRIAEERDAASGGVRRTDSGPGLLLVVPLRGAEAEDVTGYVAAVVLMDELDRQIVDLRERHFPSFEGALLVTDDTGAVLAASDARMREGTTRPALFDVVDPHTEASWSGRFSDPLGREYLAEMRHLPGRPIRVVVQVPTEIAFESLRTMQWSVAIGVLLAIVLAVLAGMVVARTLTRPMAKLVELAGDLGARRWDRPITIESNDELAILGSAMGRAATDLAASEAQIQKEMAIRSDLGRYVPQEIVERVVKREQDMGLGGVRRDITVLFADVVGFTPLTTRLSPEDTVTILNELFTILTEIVFRHGGTVDKFIGDSVMAIFGAPADQPDHAERALRTAEDMLRFLETGNATWQERYGVTIQLAIGVNTGEAVVGNIGSLSRIEYTAIGDTVNVAARLEAIARPQQILITAATKDAAGGGFEYFDGGEQELPGRKGLVHLWEVAL